MNRVNYTCLVTKKGVGVGERNFWQAKARGWVEQCIMFDPFFEAHDAIVNTAIERISGSN